MTPATQRSAGRALILLAVLCLVPAVVPAVERALSGGGNFAPIDRWAIVVLALAIFVAGHALRRGAAAFAALAFVFLTGGGAQLYLTEPLWFPALRLTPQDWRDYAMIAALALEGLVAVAVLRRPAARALLARGTADLGAGRVSAFFGLSFAFSVPVIIYISRGALLAYLAHVFAAAVLIALNLTVVIAMSLVKSPVSGLHRTTAAVPAVVTLVASLALSLFAFQHMPHVEDEVAYLFQAKMFAGGALSVDAPPEAARAGLDYYLFDIQDGRWFSATQPGWPAALALGVLVGLPWLVNPILAALSVLLAYDIARRKAGAEVADIVALTMGCSPWLIAAAASYMPHTLTLFLLLLAWWLILRGETGAGRPRRSALLAGLALGWIFVTRPLDGLLLGLLTGLWVLAGPGGSLLRASLYGLGCALAGGLLLIYNLHMTGSAFDMPLALYLDRHWAPGANAYGFGPGIGPPGGWGTLDLWPGHSPLEALINTVNLIVSLQFDLLGWTIGSLALIFAWLLWQRRGAFDLAMVIVIAVVVVAVALYWFADSYYLGPRYWFPAAFAFFYLGGRGFEALRDRFPGADGMGFTRIEAVVTLCCFFALAVFTPWRGVTKFHDYGGYHADIASAAASGSFPDASVVLVTTGGDIGSALWLNNPWLAAAPGPIFLKAQANTDEAAIAAAFPGRKIVQFTSDWTEPAAP